MRRRNEKEIRIDDTDNDDGDNDTYCDTYDDKDKETTTFLSLTLFQSKLFYSILYCIILF